MRVVTDVPHTHATCHHTGAAGPCVTACRLLTPRAPYPQSPCRVLMPLLSACGPPCRVLTPCPSMPLHFVRAVQLAVCSSHVHHTIVARGWSGMPCAVAMRLHSLFATHVCGPTCRALTPRALMPSPLVRVVQGAQATCIMPSPLVRAPTCRVRSPCASMISSPLMCGPASRVLTPRAFMPSPLVRVVQHAVLTPRASYHCRSCVIQRAVMLYTSTPLLCVNQHAVGSYHV